MDYAEPGQRALLVDGIRPVLPLIRNTPYGKRIQNKLQREQMDHFGGFPPQQALGHMALNSQAVGANGGRHMHQPLAANPLAEMYGSSGGLYPMHGQGSFGQSHINAQMHGLQPQSIDGYVLQGNSSHNQTLPPQHGSSYPAASFANFGGAVNGALNDPYQRSAFGYGM